MTDRVSSADSLHASARAMASLLQAASPASLASLRERFSTHSDLFDSTYVLGADGVSAAGSISPARQLAMKALVEATLQAGDKSIPAIVHGLSTRVRRGRTIRLGAAVATAVAGALTAASAVGTALPLPALLGPGFAFVGSVAMLVGEHWEKPLAGGQSSVGELLVDTLVAEATFADVKLRLIAEDLTREGVLVELARRAGEAAAKLRHVSVFGGLPMHAG
jgi:hypothetical protein